MTLATRDAPAVRIVGPDAVVTFSRYDLDAYTVFLRCKVLPESQLTYDWRADTYTLSTPARFAPLLGADVGGRETTPLPLAPHLFDFQAFIVASAISARRFACWCDTGLGKTLIYLEFARQVCHLTQGRVLILAPLQVIPQIVDEARRFYGDDLPIERLDTRDDLAAWCPGAGSVIGICNYEKMVRGVLPELRYLAGLIADESSLLKTGGGVIKWNLIKSARGIEYKLSCTATPAPNDTMEYASQAAFLEKIRNEGEVLWTYFSRDGAGVWSVKPHAREAFYRFMASWSIYLRDPVHFGFADILSTLPPPEMHEYPLPMGPEQRERMYEILARSGKGMFSDDRLGVTERTRLSQIAKGFIYETDIDGRRRAQPIPSAKPEAICDLVLADAGEGRQVLVWTVFDEETELLRSRLAGAVPLACLSGKTPERERLTILDGFRRGTIRVLISKPTLVGYGMNFQFCRSMIFSGFDDSFERLYQAIRRAYRYGQTETVRVHIPYVPELEGMILENVRAKQARFDADTVAMEQNFVAAFGDRLAAAV